MTENENKGLLGYRLRIIEGISWQEIAKRVGYCNRPSAISSVAHYAEKNGLPPTTLVRPDLQHSKKAEPLVELTFEEAIEIGREKMLEAIEAKKASETLRRCLSCGNDFPSEGAHNRICQNCKSNYGGPSMFD